MLSNHTLCETVDNVLYPKVKEIQSLVYDLYKKQFPSPIGPQGMTGTNELDWTIQLLDGTINLLLAIAREQGIPITRFQFLAVRENYSSKDGQNWYKASLDQMKDPSLFRLTKDDGKLILPSLKGK